MKILMFLIQFIYVIGYLDTQTSWHFNIDDKSVAKINKKEAFNISLYTSESSWWLMEQTNNTAFDAFREEKIYLRKVNLDEQMLHSCYEYKIMFVNPLKVESEHKNGFFCYPAIIITGMPKCSTSALYALLAKVPGVWLSHIKENCPFSSTSILHWFDSHPRTLKVGQIYIDACIDLPGNMLIRKMLRYPETFYIVMTRDYSSWLWSAYNFWCNDRLEKGCNVKHHFAEIELHSRSPSEFDYIVQNSANRSVFNSILGINTCDLAKDFYRSYIQLLVNEGIEENKYVVLASEELSSNIEYFTRKLSKITGLPLESDNFANFSNFRFNTQSNKGADHKVPIEDFQEGLYPISNNLPIFNETRNTLDKCWGDDCKWVSKQANYKFRACPGVDINNNSIRPFDQIQGNVDGFIHRSKEYCRVRTERNKILFKSIKTKYEMPNEKVVFFCISKTVRFDFLFLVKSAIGASISLDLSSLDDISSNNYNDRIERCKKSYILGINPKKANTLEELKSIIIKEFKRVCVLNITNREDKKLDVRAIVYANLWPKTYLWQRFVKENPVDYELLVQKHSFYSWLKWDSEIRNRTAAYAIENHVMLKDIPQLKQFSEIELYETFLNKEKVLRSIYKYIQLPDFSMSDVACDFMLLAASKNQTAEEKALAKSSQYLDAAYSSNEAYCAFQQHSFYLTDSKKRNISCDIIDSEDYPYEMCKLRYSQKRFLELTEIYKYEPIALLAVDRHEINTRLLIEYALGVYSGTTNIAVKNMFHADHYCGRRMALNYVNPDIVTIKITKSGRRTIHINKQIRQKCLKGLIRGFNRGILVIDDPFLLVYPSVLLHLARHNNSTKNLDEESVRHLALTITNDFDRTSIFPHQEIKVAAEMMQSTDEYRMISYESLLDKKMRISVLRTIAEFMRFDKLDNQRLNCAFSFLDRPTFVNAQEMLDTYRREEKLTCYMNHIFSSKLNGTVIHYRLFQNFNKIC